MKKEELMKKRFGALMLALVLAFSLAIPAGAAVIPAEDEGVMPMVVTTQSATVTLPKMKMTMSGYTYSLTAVLKGTGGIHDYNNQFSYVNDIELYSYSTNLPNENGLSAKVYCNTISKTISGSKATFKVNITVTYGTKTWQFPWEITMTAGSSVLGYKNG